MLYPKAEKLSFLIFLIALFVIKFCCDYSWRLDDDLLLAMAAFDAEQLRQDSLNEVARQQQTAAWAAQKAQRAARYEAGRREAPRERASRAPARAPQTSETAPLGTRAGAELPLAAPLATARLDLNQADSLTLLSVRGIGSYSASRILSYRRALGGYVSLDQLDEIEGLRAENLQELKTLAYVRQDSLAPTQLSVNRATFKELLAHPYLSYEQVCAIANCRRERGRVESIESLAFMDEFGPKDLHRLRPYLDFH